MKERGRDEYHSPNLCTYQVSLLFLFFLRVFFKFKLTSHKKKHKNRLRRECVVERRLSHKERRKIAREREHSRGAFIEQNRKRALIEIDRERERRNLFLNPSFFPLALFAHSFEFKKYSRGNDANERDGVEGNRETR